jgi:hypothetical protein
MVMQASTPSSRRLSSKKPIAGRKFFDEDMSKQSPIIRSARPDWRPIASKGKRAARWLTNGRDHDRKDSLYGRSWRSKPWLLLCTDDSAIDFRVWLEADIVVERKHRTATDCMVEALQVSRCRARCIDIEVFFDPSIERTIRKGDRPHHDEDCEVLKRENCARPGIIDPGPSFVATDATRK